MACDEKAIRPFGDEAKSEYVLSIINMAKKIKHIRWKSSQSLQFRRKKQLNEPVLVTTSEETVEIIDREGDISISKEEEEMQFCVEGKNLSSEPVMVNTSDGEVMISQNEEIITFTDAATK